MSIAPKLSGHDKDLGGSFSQVAGDSEFIPLPERKPKPA